MESSRGETQVPYPAVLDFDLVTQQPPAVWLEVVEDEIERAGGLLGDMAFSQSDWESLGNAFRHIGNGFLRRPYAIAPIRTGPQRTYDPISAEPKPEGSHVPMLLAALSRSAPQGQWEKLQSALQEFGLKSGLFDGIEIVDKARRRAIHFSLE